jgi:succinoglycan biosynthesis protein ExoW
VINAALRQKGVSNYTIVIVDDGAPWPALEELKDLPDDDWQKIRLLTQRNAGPGAARNAALESVDSDTEYVAFLDSDDRWTEGHLENAVWGLQRGYDFYFANFRPLGETDRTAFTRFDLSHHQLLDEQRSMYAFRGNMLDQIIVRGSPIGTSTAVYRFSRFRDLRFREQFYNGQDVLFWLEVSRRSARFVFSARLECRYGTGVNIFSGAGWESDRSLELLKNLLFLYKSIGKTFQLTARQRVHNNQRIGRLREATVRDILHRLHQRSDIPTDVLRDLLLIDPLLLLNALPLSGRIGFEWIRRRWLR